MFERARDVERARVLDDRVPVAMRSRYPRSPVVPGSDTHAAVGQKGQIPAMFSEAATVNGPNPVTTAWMNSTLSTLPASQ